MRRPAPPFPLLHRFPSSDEGCERAGWGVRAAGEGVCAAPLLVRGKMFRHVQCTGDSNFCVAFTRGEGAAEGGLAVEVRRGGAAGGGGDGGAACSVLLS